jgi:hypothetical protein
MRGAGNMKINEVVKTKKYVGVFVKRDNRFYALVDDWKRHQVERKVFKDSEGHYILLDGIKQYIEFPASESEFEVRVMQGITFCQHIL